MKNIKIEPSNLRGDISAPPSKSVSHRALICAGLADGESVINNIIFSEDMKATINGLSSLGSKFNMHKNSVSVVGNNKFLDQTATIDCNESGSTIRFLIPLASLLSSKSIIVGSERLGERPLTTFYEIFESQGLKYTTTDNKLPLTIFDKLKPGTFKVKGNISSQFISGLMFALPLLEEDSKIIITTDLESKGYIDLTIDMLKSFNIEIINNDYKEFFVKKNQEYIPKNITIESDFSQAAFWIVAGLIGESMHLKNINTDSLQGDRAIMNIVRNMGGKIQYDMDSIEVLKSKTFGTIIDVSQIPDLVPILAVLASVSKGTTKLINGARLRIKESDRLLSTATELKKLGADITEENDGLVINGKESLIGGTVDSWNDHRIAMAMAIASIRCTEPVVITNCDAVNKSYPHFWDDFKKLGGDFNEFHLG